MEPEKPVGYTALAEYAKELKQKKDNPFYWSKPSEFASTRDLLVTCPNLRPYVIDGLCRKGEVINLIAPPKIGKTLLVMSLAWAIETGAPWLGHSVKQGRVLLVDAELHDETLSRRCDQIAKAMGVNQVQYAFDILRLRGKSVDILSLKTRFAEIPPGKYSLIILDALYRFLPVGTSENDNSSMLQIYNRLDSYAEQLGTAIMVIHHTSKGQQGEKSVTDVGSGAGAVSRAADSHIVLRQHSNPDLIVFEAATRSCQAPQAKSLKLNYPLWTVVDDEPRVRKASDRSGADQKADLRDAEKILALVPTRGRVQQSKLLKDLEGIGIKTTKARRLISEMLKGHALTKVPKGNQVFFKRTSKKVKADE
jgi:hypothetical protein